MSQAAPQTFTRQDARSARRSYQHIAAVVDRLIQRDVQRLDEETAKRFFKPSILATVHALHGFLNGREVSHDKPVMKAHKFVIEHFPYRGDRENDQAVARYMARQLVGLANAEEAVGHRYVTVVRANDEQLFTSYEGTPLLVAMGGALNLICVDIDPRNDGDASYSDLVDAHGDDAFPETFTVKTGGGGWHRYYRLPYTIRAQKGELKGKLGPGIDIKGAGGQVVAPGSVHSSGALYAVETNEYIAEAPGWMVSVLLKSAAGETPEVVADFQAHRDRRRAGAGGPTIVEGERNERLFRVGCALWGKGEVGSRAELLQRLLDTNSERVSPPLDPGEVWKIAESIAGRYPPGVPTQGDAA